MSHKVDILVNLVVLVFVAVAATCVGLLLVADLVVGFWLFSSWLGVR